MPENNKKSFIMYSNYRKFLSMLSDSEIANLMRAIFCFVEDEEIPELDSKTDICFAVITDQIERDREKYQKVCERRANAGRLGGKQKHENRLKREAVKEGEKEVKEEEKTDEKDVLANASKPSKCKQMLANASKSSKSWQSLANLANASKSSKSWQSLANLANLADNDNDNENENDNENDNDIAIDKDIAIDIYKNKNKDIAIDNIYKNNIYKKKKNTQKEKENYSTEFECFWEVYPRKSDKGEAYKKYLTRLKDGWSPEQLLTAAKKYRAQIITNRTDQKYIKLCKTFLSDTTPFTDYLTKTERQGVSSDTENPYAEWKDGANG